MKGMVYRMKFLQKIFSVAKERNNKKIRKVITILGLKIKVRDKASEQLEVINQLVTEKQVVDMSLKNISATLSLQAQQLQQLNCQTNSLIPVNQNLQALTNNLKPLVQAQFVHPNTFGSYKNKHLGQTITLIASGPSVKDFEPFTDSIYVGVNNSVLYDKVKFDYLFLQELHKDNSKNKVANEYIGNNCQKFYGIIPDNRLKDVYPIVKNIPQSHIVAENIHRFYLEDIFSHKFSADIEHEPLGDFGGTVFSAMQFILYTHPKTIYLVGCDCSSGYFFNNAALDIDTSPQVRSWKFLKTFVDDYYPDIKIISVNPVGLKGLFEDIYTRKDINEKR